MKRISRKEARQLEKAMPEFTALLNSSSRGLRINLTDFEDEPDLLYRCLWYAASRGRWVLVQSDRIG